MDTESLLNKLEIHFSKSKHGGGEVDECEMLPDSGTVVLTFMEKDSEQMRPRLIRVECYKGGNSSLMKLFLPSVARGLTEAEYHEVKLSQKKHKVRVTPFLNGSITNLKVSMKVEVPAAEHITVLQEPESSFGPLLS